MKHRSQILNEGTEQANTVSAEALRRETSERLARHPAEYAGCYDEFCTVAKAVWDWEFKESCRQTMEEWSKTGPWCGLGIPMAYYACRYEDNPPRSECERIKARMDEMEEKHPGITAIMDETEAAAIALREAFWSEYVEKHRLLAR